jgi:predicted transglutaminase-like cysteine proteinase
MIRQQAYKLKGKDIYETALNIEKWLNKYITYYFDQDNNFHKGYVEWWQQASLTFAMNKGDCDDYAIVFQTMMHQLGYGKETITCAGSCDFSAFKQGMVGHAYNMVMVNNEWLVFDACNGLINRNKIKYPELKDTWFFMNYYNVFKI